MTDDELKKIIERHEKWLKDQEGGERANLRGADLRGADLRGADLCGANLRDANLCGANLRGADLCGANLRDADLCDANLCGADLRDADLRDANLCDANLCDADLRDADLRDAKNAPFIPMSCPDSGSFTAWKKANGMIVKLLIPEDARRSSATRRKCRCDKAVVLAIETVDGEPAETQSVCSDYRKEFVYGVGKTVEEPNFSEDRFKECAPGIHFFINRKEAVDYNS